MEISRNKTRQDLDQNRVLNLALIRLIEIIGEAANVYQLISKADSLVDMAANDWSPKPSDPWLRCVDFDILWTILKQDLPVLIGQLETILKDEKNHHE